MAGRKPGKWWKQIGPVFTAQRGVATGRGAVGGGGSSGGNNLSGARGAAGVAGQLRRFPRPSGLCGRHAQRKRSRLWPPAVLAQSGALWSATPSPSSQLGLPFSVGSPTGLPGGATAEHMVTTHHVPGIAQSFYLMAM